MTTTPTIPTIPIPLILESINSLIKGGADPDSLVMVVDPKYLAEGTVMVIMAEEDVKRMLKEANDQTN